MSTQLNKSIKGTNFWVVIILLVASIVGGMSEDQAHQIAGVITGIIGAVAAFRNWLKTVKLTTAKSWIGDPNNWAYVTAVVSALIPQFADFVPAIQDLANAIISGNWGAIITAGVSLLTLVYYLLLKSRTTQKE